MLIMSRFIKRTKVPPFFRLLTDCVKSPADVCQAVVEHALKTGYRHVSLALFLPSNLGVDEMRY